MRRIEQNFPYKSLIIKEFCSVLHKLSIIWWHMHGTICTACMSENNTLSVIIIPDIRTHSKYPMVLMDQLCPIWSTSPILLMEVAVAQQLSQLPPVSKGSVLTCLHCHVFHCLMASMSLSQDKIYLEKEQTCTQSQFQVQVSCYNINQ